MKCEIKLLVDPSIHCHPHSSPIGGGWSVRHWGFWIPQHFTILLLQIGHFLKDKPLPYWLKRSWTQQFIQNIFASNKCWTNNFHSFIHTFDSRSFFFKSLTMILVIVIDTDSNYFPKEVESCKRLEAKELFCGVNVMFLEVMFALKSL